MSANSTKLETCSRNFIFSEVELIPDKLIETIINVCNCFTGVPDILRDKEQLKKYHLFIYVQTEEPAVGLIKHAGQTSSMYPSFITLSELEVFVVQQMLDKTLGKAYLQSLVKVLHQP